MKNKLFITFVALHCCRLSVASRSSIHTEDELPSTGTHQEASDTSVSVFKAKQYFPCDDTGKPAHSPSENFPDRKLFGAMIVEGREGEWRVAEEQDLNDSSKRTRCSQILATSEGVLIGKYSPSFREALRCGEEPFPPLIPGDLIEGKKSGLAIRYTGIILNQSRTTVAGARASIQPGTIQMVPVPCGLQLQEPKEGVPPEPIPPTLVSVIRPGGEADIAAFQFSSIEKRFVELPQPKIHQAIRKQLEAQLALGGNDERAAAACIRKIDGEAQTISMRRNAGDRFEETLGGSVPPSSGENSSGGQPNQPAFWGDD